MNELERLLFEKREIEKKINELKSGNYTHVGCVRLEKKDKDDHAWQIAFLTLQTHTGYETRAEAAKHGRTYKEREKVVSIEVDRWQNVYRENTKEDAIKRIELMINDMQELYKQLLYEGEKQCTGIINEQE